MSRKRPERISAGERNRVFDEFWTMIALLESREEVKNFFKDLLSPTETLMLSRRVQIAKLLLSGKSYDDIQELLGTASTTISTVHRWLQEGNGGYLQGLPRLEKELKRSIQVKQRKREEKEPFSLAWMQRKYPLHFLLLNMLKEGTTKPPKKISD